MQRSNYRHKVASQYFSERIKVASPPQAKIFFAFCEAILAFYDIKFELTMFFYFLHKVCLYKK